MATTGLSSQTTAESVSMEVRWLEKGIYEADHTTGDNVVVDLATVVAICSEDLNQLIQLSLKIRQEGRELVLENVQPQVWQVFMLTRLDRIFDVRHTSLS